MKHLIICREYPPAPSGGIGTYVFHISRLLAEHGETVHVIGQLWKGAERNVEEQYQGRLILHRVPFEDWKSFPDRKPCSAMKSRREGFLFASNFYPQCFSWQASILAERLVDQEGIDLIEAQEYEAPLYYFLLRRALGLGAKREPPCIIQLHSPTEIITAHNDWNLGIPAVLTAKRLEDYCIAAADALLCPSSYLARQAEIHYGLREGSIHVIPLPLGDNSVLERDEKTWERGTICYVGRLERRKGVFEWIDAAVSVARQYPSARFEFVGANILGTRLMSGEEAVQRRIPRDLGKRFLFRGAQERTSIPQFLRGARMAVVPSRWENFPNTCMEAMCSGLPVIASREGGMVEMIEDGRTGWLAPNPGIEGLAEALKSALETPPQRISEMGREASASIRRMCGNENILEKHLVFRRALLDRGPRNSSRLAANLPWSKTPRLGSNKHRISKDNSTRGLAIVVTCRDDRKFLGRCLQSLERQTQRPMTVVVVGEGLNEEQAWESLNPARNNGWQVIQKRQENPALAKNYAVETVLQSSPAPLGFAFLSVEDRVEANFVATCEWVLQRCPEVGLVSFWTQDLNAEDRIWIKPCAAFPYQLLWNEVSPLSVVRTDALCEAGNFNPAMNQGYEDWDLFNAVMAAGWVAVTVPEILGEHRFRETDFFAHGRMRKELLNRFPELINQDAKELVLLTELSVNWELSALREQLAQVAMVQNMPLHLKWCEFLYSNTEKLALERKGSYTVTFNYKAVEVPSANGGYYFLARTTSGGYGNDKAFTKWSDTAGTVGSKTIDFTLGDFDDYYLIWGIHGQGALSIDDIKVTNRSGGKSFDIIEDFESGDFASTLFSLGGEGGQIVSDAEKVVSGKFSAYGKGDPAMFEKIPLGVLGRAKKRIRQHTPTSVLNLYSWIKRNLKAQR